MKITATEMKNYNINSRIINWFAKEFPQGSTPDEIIKKATKEPIYIDDVNWMLGNKKPSYISDINWILVNFMTLNEQRRYSLFAGKKALQLIEPKFNVNRLRKAIKASERVLKNDKHSTRLKALNIADAVCLETDGTPMVSNAVFSIVHTAITAAAPEAATTAADEATTYAITAFTWANDKKTINTILLYGASLMNKYKTQEISYEH